MEQNTTHLKEWFDYEVKGEFSIKKVEEKEGIPHGSLAKFQSGERSYLGIAEDRVFAWAKRRGYNPDYQYNPIV